MDGPSTSEERSDVRPGRGENGEGLPRGNHRGAPQRVTCLSGGVRSPMGVWPQPAA